MEKGMTTIRQELAEKRMLLKRFTSVPRNCTERHIRSLRREIAISGKAAGARAAKTITQTELVRRKNEFVPPLSAGNPRIRGRI